MRRAVLVALALGLIAAALPSAAALQAPTDPPVRVGGSIQPPIKIKDVKPVYPPAAQQARVSGVVIIEATIGEDGKVRNARVLRSIPLLDEAALASVRQWEFTPTIVDGKPRAVIMTVTVNFALLGVPPVAAAPTAAGPASTAPPVQAAQLSGLIRLFAYRPQNNLPLVAWEITPDRASHLPHWNLETQPPALTVVDATRIARAWLSGRYAQVQRFELQSANMSHVRRSVDIDFWYYQLTFNGYGTAQPPVNPYMAVVLPDGSLVEPTDTAASGPPVPPPPSPQAVARAGALFQEARDAIPLADSQSPLVPRDQVQAGLFSELAIAELATFGARASDDAERAVELVKRLPGGGRDFAFTREVTPAAMGRMAKQQVEYDMVRTLVAAGQLPRARGVAAAADIERADVYSPIVMAAPLDQVREIAMECRRADGSYPYGPVAVRIREMAAENPVRRALLDEIYASAPIERTFKDRSLALTFFERTYDLVPADRAAAAVDKLLEGMVAEPTFLEAQSDLEQFGPTILELMMRLEPSRGAAIALAHPGWDEQRKQPGRTPFNVLGAPPGTTFQPSQMVSPPPDIPRLPGPIPPLPADLDAELKTVRSLAAEERAPRLIALARALLNQR